MNRIFIPIIFAVALLLSAVAALPSQAAKLNYLSGEPPEPVEAQAGEMPMCDKGKITNLYLEGPTDGYYQDGVRCRLFTNAENRERAYKISARKSEAFIVGAGRVLGWFFGLIALLLIIYYSRDAYKAVVRAHIRARREVESDLNGDGKCPRNPP